MPMARSWRRPSSVCWRGERARLQRPVSFHGGWFASHHPSTRRCASCSKCATSGVSRCVSATRAWRQSLDGSRTRRSTKLSKLRWLDLGACARSTRCAAPLADALHRLQMRCTACRCTVLLAAARAGQPAFAGLHCALPGVPRVAPRTTNLQKGEAMKRLVPTLLLVPATALASSAFDGTWKANLESVKQTGKPDVYLLAHGEYACSSCSPALNVKADGAEHKVSGHAYYDTVMVKVTGPNSDEQLLKQGDKPLAHFTETVSADGKTLIQKITNYAGAQPVTFEVKAKRVAPGPAGSHPVSGSWQQATFQGDDASRTVKYQMTN